MNRRFSTAARRSHTAGASPAHQCDVLRQDLLYAWRRIRQQPGFTLTAVLVLALGIGVNAVVFSLVQGILLRPLPYPEPEGLVRVWPANPEGGLWGVSLHELADWRQQSRGVEHFAAYEQRSGNLSDGEVAERIRYAIVSSGFFKVLGVPPALGRTFLAQEDVPGHDAVAVLSHELWQRSFGADSDVLGKAVTLNGEQLTVIGVMPSGFRYPIDDSALLWKPIGMTVEESGDRQGRWLKAIARLQPGVSLQMARSEMATIARRLAASYPETNEGWSIVLESLHKASVGSVRPALLVLWAAVGLVLLITCANVAGLFLSRAAARSREIALRGALGAGRRRVIRQLLTETVLLAFLGGIGGLLFAAAGIRFLPRLAAGSLPRLHEIGLDLGVLGFTLALSVASGVLAGLVPALRGSRLDLSEALRPAGLETSGSQRRRLRAGLVVAEVALALTLLVGAGLLARSFTGLLRLDPGFDPRQVLTLRIEPPWNAQLAGATEQDFRDEIEAERRRTAFFYRSLRERIEALPGVISAAAINRRPLSGGDWWSTTYLPEGVQPSAPGVDLIANYRVVTPGYFSTLDIPLLEGRVLGEGDGETARRVVVISHAMARDHWPGESALGKRLTFGDPESPHSVSATVVGVVGDVRSFQIDTEPRLAIYAPFPQAHFGHFLDWGMDLMIETAADPLASVGAVRQAVAALDPTLPMFQVQSMAQVVGDDLAESRFNTSLLTLFAAFATALAAIGIYGVLSQVVAGRTREIGIRKALGAGRGDLLRMVIGQGMTPVAGGLMVGVAMSVAVTRFLNSLLFGVEPLDPVAFAAACALLAWVAALACYLPARRAARVDATVAFRCE